MATYSSYDQMKQSLIQRGYPPEKAEKLASQKFIRSTGERPSKLKKQGKAPKQYDPNRKRVARKQAAKKRKPVNSSTERILALIMEDFGVTGLIGGPIGATPLPGGSTPGAGGSTTSSTKVSPSHSYKDKDDEEDDEKKNRPKIKAAAGSTSAKGSVGFSAKGIQKMKVEKAKPGQVAKRPEGMSDSIISVAKQIEEEFGIR